MNKELPFFFMGIAEKKKEILVICSSAPSSISCLALGGK